MKIVSAFEDHVERSAFVTVRDGDVWVQHHSFLRGGCLYSGWADVRDLRSGFRTEIPITSWATADEAHAKYLVGIARKAIANSTPPPPRSFPALVEEK